VAALVLTLAVAAVSALVAVVTTGDASRAAGTASLVAVIAAPLGRSLWLGVRWLRKGDRRFALVAAAVLAIVAAGGAVATVTG
jgi:hypothetical protein